MDAKKLERYRKKLMELRSQILNRAMVRTTDALRINAEDLVDETDHAAAMRINAEDLVDETDHAAAMTQQNISLNVQERDRFLLREIEHALSKFETGDYGICEDTEEPIDEARLELQPWTRYSVEAAEMREKKQKRFMNFG